VRWFVEAPGTRRIEDRPELLRALCSLGRDGSILCVAQPQVLDDTTWGSAVVEHVAAHAGGRVEYAAWGSRAGSPDLVPALDAHERLLLRFDVARAKELKQPRDAFWGRCPWGYRLSADGLHLEPNTSEQAVTTVIKHMRLRGLKLRQIRDELTLLGVVGRTGKPLGISRIHALLDENEGTGGGELDNSGAADADAPPASVARPSARPPKDLVSRLRRRGSGGA
jgi:hypothetical protein